MSLMIEAGSKSSSGYVHLFWSEPDAKEGVDHYIISRSTQPDKLVDSLAVASGTSYADTGLVGNTSVYYYYTVKAVDGVGNKSEPSNKVREFDMRLARVK